MEDQRKTHRRNFLHMLGTVSAAASIDLLTKGSLLKLNAAHAAELSYWVGGTTTKRVFVGGNPMV